MVGGAALSMREVWHNDAVIDAHFAVICVRRKVANRLSANVSTPRGRIQFLCNSSSIRYDV
jgi:hypothetical protein